MASFNSSNFEFGKSSHILRTRTEFEQRHRCREKNLLPQLTLSSIFHFVTQGGGFRSFTHESVPHDVCTLLTNNSLSRSLFRAHETFAYCIAPAWEKTIIDAAGSMGSIVLAGIQLTVASVFKSYISWYVSWPIALALGGGAVIWMFSELLNSYDLTSQENNESFGRIAQRGQTHLALARIALVSCCALGIIGATCVCS